ncbi:uncharacterized protein BJ171DRAFT_515963 [Polychytrium aggregatum]|uniref:uncharacterized protein n=1 Tax=Polychytrium aggregatum TaxID=110093 RepID=UPI0022FEE9A3|nr:uncharacterized protein BJ171DRAFT_515963 [Polychytrium aggregatum]KAI9201929.1 hypothetical protein BJ171DRAFT_515963 [Polychytrium aggregatum]
MSSLLAAATPAASVQRLAARVTCISRCLSRSPCGCPSASASTLSTLSFNPLQARAGRRTTNLLLHPPSGPRLSPGLPLQSSVARFSSSSRLLLTYYRYSRERKRRRRTAESEHHAIAILNALEDMLGKNASSLDSSLTPLLLRLRDFDALQQSRYSDLDWFELAIGLAAQRHPQLLSPLDLSLLASLCARKSAATPQLLDDHSSLLYSIAAEFIRRADAFDPPALADILHAFTLMQLDPQSPFFEHWHEAFRARNLDEFDHASLARIAWSLARLGVRDDRFFEYLTKLMSTDYYGFSAQDLANLVWALAVQELAPPNLDAITGVLLSSDGFLPPGTPTEALESLDSHELVNLLWSYARLGRPSHRLFSHAAPLITSDSVKRLSHVELTNLIWAYSVAGVRSRTVSTNVSYAASKLIHLFDPQSLSTFLSAFVTLRLVPRKFFLAVPRHILMKIDIFPPAEISRILSAYATSGIHIASLFRSACVEFSPRVSEFGLSELCRCMTAFQISSTRIRFRFLKRAVRHLQPQLQHLDNETLCTIMTSLGRPGYDVGPDFHAELARVILARAADAKPDVLCAIARYFSSPDIVEPAGLFDKIGQAAMARLRQLQGQQLCCLLGSFAELGYRPEFEPLYQAGLERLSELWDTLDPSSQQAFIKMSRTLYPRPHQESLLPPKTSLESASDLWPPSDSASKGPELTTEPEVVPAEPIPASVSTPIRTVGVTATSSATPIACPDAAIDTRPEPKSSSPSSARAVAESVTTISSSTTLSQPLASQSRPRPSATRQPSSVSSSSSASSPPPSSSQPFDALALSIPTD